MDMNEMNMKEIELSEKDLDAVIGGQNDSRQQPGLNCPQCGSFIPLTIDTIQNSRSVTCTKCYLRLNIDRTTAGQAIEALKKVKDAQDKFSQDQ